MSNEELERLWATHREAAFAHYGATAYRAAMCQWMPPAAQAASDAFLAELAAERAKTHAAWVSAWNTTYPETLVGAAFDSEAYDKQQATTGQLQAA
jgi:hypothetical protein